MRRGILFVAAAASLLRAPRLASGQSVPRTRGPCAGCLSSVPAGDAPAPLLVVLHGDGDTPDAIFDAWAGVASKRGIMVLAPACPRSEGCTAMSWWKWNGDPSWLGRQVDALNAQRAIDRARMWIVGWSGGGTYLGWHTQELERDYAAMVIHGGGVRPALPSCAPSPAGIYFLGGDANPFTTWRSNSTPTTPRRVRIQTSSGRYCRGGITRESAPLCLGTGRLSSTGSPRTDTPSRTVAASTAAIRRSSRTLPCQRHHPPSRRCRRRLQPFRRRRPRAHAERSAPGSPRPGAG